MRHYWQRGGWGSEVRLGFFGFRYEAGVLRIRVANWLVVVSRVGP